MIIGFFWTFVLAIIVNEFLEGLVITFSGYMALFFIVLVYTVAVETMIPENKHRVSERLSELQDLRSRLDEIAKNLTDQ